MTMRAARRFFISLLAVIAVVGEPPARCSRADEPSPEYQAAVRRTLELRRERRQARAARPAPVGVIVPYPMPPALIIRHTRETHDEIGALLWLLRH
jgi:hypothetical protein